MGKFFGVELALADYANTGVYTLSSDNPDIYLKVVPEPGTIALLGIGLAGLFALRKRFGIRK